MTSVQIGRFGLDPIVTNASVASHSSDSLSISGIVKAGSLDELVLLRSQLLALDDVGDEPVVPVIVEGATFGFWRVESATWDESGGAYDTLFAAEWKVNLVDPQSRTSALFETRTMMSKSSSAPIATPWTAMTTAAQGFALSGVSTSTRTSVSGELRRFIGSGLSNASTTWQQDATTAYVGAAMIRAGESGMAAGSVPPSTIDAATYTEPGTHDYVVPAGVTKVRVRAVGGWGGNASDGTLGGAPAVVTCELDVTAGETLRCVVAGNGGAGTNITLAAPTDVPTGAGDGGVNGGGDGGDGMRHSTSAYPSGQPWASGGGGGGGASDVRQGGTATTNRVIVAGGGGGATRGRRGGDAGVNGAGGGPAAYAGSGGTATTGGTGGPSLLTGATLTSVGGNGTTAGAGGDGGTFPTPNSFHFGGGGGGGGGWTGGGGGSGWASLLTSGTLEPTPTWWLASSGGGGSSLAPSTPGAQIATVGTQAPLFNQPAVSIAPVVDVGVGVPIDDIDYHTVVGRRAEIDPWGWMLDNGIVRVRHTYSATDIGLAVETWTGTGWTDPVIVGIFRWVTSTYQSAAAIPATVTILRNAPEAVALRITYAGNSYTEQHTMDLALRRGAAWVDIAFDSTASGSQWAARHDPAVAASALDANNDGIIATTGDANGHKWFLSGLGTVDTTGGGGVIGVVGFFFVTCHIGWCLSGETATDLAKMARAVGAETIRVVSA